MTQLCFRFAGAAERQALEDPQRRASLEYEVYRPALLANPGAIHSAGIATARTACAWQKQAARFWASAWSLAEGDVCELDGLYVEPGHWRRGIGRALMEDGFALGRAGGAWMMEVTANPQSEGFYVRLDFARTGLVTTSLWNCH